MLDDPYFSDEYVASLIRYNNGFSAPEPAPPVKKRKPRRTISSKEYEILRASVLERDGYACVDCGAPAQHVHHLVPKLDQKDYLVSLCKACHRARHPKLPDYLFQ